MKKVFRKENRALLAELVRTDFKLRYQGSVLGYLWSVLKPLLMFAILYTVFVKFLRIGADIENFPIYLLFGIVIWSFFTEMTGQSLSSIVMRGDLIRKIRIPRWIIVLSSSISALISLGINMVIVIIFMAFSGVDIRPEVLLLPLIFIQIYIFALGTSLILATAYVKYRDVSHIWEVIVQAGFYVTPILYPLSYVIDNVSLFAAKLIMLNPMAQTIQDARYVLISDQTQTVWSLFNNFYIALLPVIFTFLALFVGVMYFKREAKNFAEDL